jgi:hypothetical protein
MPVHGRLGFSRQGGIPIPPLARGAGMACSNPADMVEDGSRHNRRLASAAKATARPAWIWHCLACGDEATSLRIGKALYRLNAKLAQSKNGWRQPAISCSHKYG